ncbi:AMP-binding protein [Wenyingzhuangia sp. chi5]|uniref:AMP-binding protein n=1 Tax=Wenyingzhuangia gilva TaxID=3057677 RepID=A0ABT8VMN9_9FLAO|nr:AMP-binding protein [Wenyingzhuangia sp. chi5]MDO3693235.1 AMP-binding protein [Wenyingzhuangia sp. chi5]
MHKSFKLQGESFQNPLELISFSETISEELYWFLQEWFSDAETLIVQTSGSTGKPKLISIKKELMQNSAKATGTFFDLGIGTKALCCLSVNYIAGKMMVIRALTLGWELDVIEPVGNPLENAFEEYDFCAMVPMQVQASLWDLNLVKKLLIGGGVVSQTLQEDLQSLSTECFASYGMTETVSHIAVKKLNHFNSTPLDDENTKDSKKEVFERSREVNLSDVEGNGLRAESRSFYQVLPNITISQDNRACLVIDAPLLSEEKVITNDVVKMISDNEFEWLGRYDHVINSGGVKLHPEQIEKELSKIIVERFFVTGIPDEILGEKLILVVEGEDRVCDFSSLALSKYQIPKQTYFIDQFVETETKKIQRKATLKLLF